MNPYQVIGIIVGCTMTFAGVVTGLVTQGVPLFLAFLGVYLIAVAFMVSMQHRACESYECGEHFDRRSYDRESTARRVRINDFNEEKRHALGAGQMHA